MDSEKFRHLAGMRNNLQTPPFNPKFGPHTPNPEIIRSTKDKNGAEITINSTVSINNPQLIVDNFVGFIKHSNDNGLSPNDNFQTKFDTTKSSDEDDEKMILRLITDHDSMLRQGISDELLKSLKEINSTFGFEITKIERDNGKEYVTVKVSEFLIKFLFAKGNPEIIQRWNYAGWNNLVTKEQEKILRIWSIRLPNDSFIKKTPLIPL